MDYGGYRFHYWDVKSTVDDVDNVLGALHSLKIMSHTVQVLAFVPLV